MTQRREDLGLDGKPQSGNERWSLSEATSPIFWGLAEAFAACMELLSGGAWYPVVGAGPHRDGESLVVRVGARSRGGKFRFVGTVLFVDTNHTLLLTALALRVAWRIEELIPEHPDAAQREAIAELRKLCSEADARLKALP